MREKKIQKKGRVRERKIRLQRMKSKEIGPKKVSKKEFKIRQLINGFYAFL